MGEHIELPEPVPMMLRMLPLGFYRPIPSIGDALDFLTDVSERVVKTEELVGPSALSMTVRIRVRMAVTALSSRPLEAFLPLPDDFRDMLGRLEQESNRAFGDAFKQQLRPDPDQLDVTTTVSTRALLDDLMRVAPTDPGGRSVVLDIGRRLLERDGETLTADEQNELSKLHQERLQRNADAQRGARANDHLVEISRAPKRRAVIYRAILDYLRAQPTSSNREVWESFPDGKDEEQTVGEDLALSVFRDHDKLYESNSQGKKNTLRSIGRRKFDGYMTAARDELRINSRQKKRSQ